MINKLSMDTFLPLIAPAHLMGLSLNRILMQVYNAMDYGKWGAILASVFIVVGLPP